MLTRLEIRNFAVIEHAVFCPGEGLNVISGETGAGKSLLIDAISLIYGGKASKELIRNDSDGAYVEAVFECEQNVLSRIRPFMDEYGIPSDDDTVIISRSFRESGKSITRINGVSVVLPALRSISRELIDIHGQNDNSRIFDASVHIELLDAYAADQISGLLAAYRDKLNEYKDLSLEYKKITALSEVSSSKKDYLEFAVKEIEQAGLKEGEDEQLSARKKELSVLKKEQYLVTEIMSLISGSDPNGLSVAGRLKEALRNMKKLTEKDPSYSGYTSRLESLALDMEAFEYDLAGKAETSSFSEEEEKEVSDRLGRIYELESKYGKTISDINAFALSAASKLHEIEEAGTRVNELKKLMSDTKNELLKIAEELSGIRKEQAKSLSDLITSELSDLEMPQASFEVRFGTRPKDRYFNINGIDDVRFMFSANPGQPPADLTSVSSGGEASRIMLAIKSILSKADSLPTLIFDEIDTGVSGKASLAIARKLRSISKEHQVLCVSHTAQLAAACDNNFLIEKRNDGNKTYTDIIPLDDEERVAEVSRLLSGAQNRESNDLARKMISELRA